MAQPIDSNDPQAEQKLRARIAELEGQHAKIKARSHRGWELQNIRQNIRRLEARLEGLERHQAAVKAAEESPRLTGVDAEGQAISSWVDDERVHIQFSNRLERSAYQEVRAWGFLWSPARLAFVRKVSPRALTARDAVLAKFGFQPATETAGRG